MGHNYVVGCKMDNLNQGVIHIIMKSIVYILYLFFIFLSIQICILWVYIDKKIVKSIITGSFLRKNLLYLLSFLVFSLLYDMPEGIKEFDIYFMILRILSPLALVLVSYEWYGKLRPCVSKLLPRELTNTGNLLRLP